MATIERYLDAATRANTQRSYASATRHFEVEWGGHLPATADSVARYLADYAEQLSINTLKLRLAALAQWHTEHGFADPTRAPLVRKVFKGIKAVHPAMEKQAEPLQITHLSRVCDWLDAEIAKPDLNKATRLRYLRDRALVLLGFWRGFRGDELMRLHVEHIRVVPGEGMICFLPRSKGDRQNEGNSFKVPALSRLCPVTAVGEWIAAAGLTQGPLFRSVNRWGNVNTAPLHENSFIPLLRRVFADAGLESPERYSGHSLRRGFAGWANDNGWDVKALMEYVGWKDIQSAMRYIDGNRDWVKERMETSVAAAQTVESKVLPVPKSEIAIDPARTNELTLHLSLTSFTGVRSRRPATALRLMLATSLTRVKARALNKEKTQFTIYIKDDDDIDEVIAILLDELSRIAENHHCLMSASVDDPHSDRRWE